MAKLTLISIQGKKSLKCRLSRNESINGRELDFLAACPTQCFMRPVMKSDKSLVFVGADGMSAVSALKSKLTKNKYFLIVAQLIEMLRSAQQYGFDLNNLVLDPKIMLMNPKTCQLFIPYLPITDCETTNDGIVRCLREISTIARFASEYDFSYADGFMCHVMSMGRFSGDDADDYIREVSPNTAKELAMLPNIQSLKGILHTLESNGIFLDRKPSVFQLIFGAAAVGIPQKKKDEPPKPIPSLPEPEPDMPLSDTESSFERPKPLKEAELSEHGEDIDADELEQLITHLYEPSDENSAFERPKNTEKTAESTALLDIPQSGRTPVITRRSTGKTFIIDKAVFRIGKEKARVDLYVSENPAVSRVHVHILTRNGIYYIVDQNSTNRTFVNGIHVPPQVEYKLRDGDEIKLANEFFDFKVNL